MAGDLNLKKSWNPALVKNQKKVWEEEQAKLDELKRIRELSKEHEREQEYLNLLKLQHGSDFDSGDLSAAEKLRLNKLSWMYADVGERKATKNAAGFIERDDELPDKEKVESLLAGSSAVRVARHQSVMDKVISASTKKAVPGRTLDDDPLLQIKKQLRISKFKGQQNARSHPGHTYKQDRKRHYDFSENESGSTRLNQPHHTPMHKRHHIRDDRHTSNSLSSNKSETDSHDPRRAYPAEKDRSHNLESTREATMSHEALRSTSEGVNSSSTSSSSAKPSKRAPPKSLAY